MQTEVVTYEAEQFADVGLVEDAETRIQPQPPTVHA